MFVDSRTPVFFGNRLFLMTILTAITSLLVVCGRTPRDKAVDALPRARAYVDRLQEAQRIPGLAVAVALNGKTIWAEGFGFADVADQVPATPQTVFRIGSLSKVLTTTAVALLYEEGKLDLDAAVQQYVPEFPEKEHFITTRQLAGHLAGIRHYNWGEVRPTKRYDDVIEALEVFKDDPLISPPGTRFSYSSYGWTLVSAVVQRAANQSFLDYMKRNVFEPLAMHRTYPDQPDLAIPDRATLYEEQENVAATNLTYIWAAGGFLSTAEDLLRFGNAFLPENDFLKPETMETLFKRQKTDSGETIRYGIGWMIDELTNGDTIYHHGGTLVGGHASLLVNPDRRLVVVMLANEDSGFGVTEAIQIGCYFLELRECPEVVGERERRSNKVEQVTLLLEALRQWELGMENGSMDGVIATFGENFTSDIWLERADLERSLSSGGVEVDTEEVHIRSAGWDVGATIRIEDVKIGETSVVVNFIRDASGWKIAGIQKR